MDELKQRDVVGALGPGHTIEVRPLADREEIEASQRLRYEIWSHEGAVLRSKDRGKIADHLDDEAFHWGAFAGARIVASARMTIHQDLLSAPDGYLFKSHAVKCPVADINRMVVLPEYRRLGIARMIDELRLQKARECGCKTIIASPVKETASLTRLKSYGFTFTGVDGTVEWGTLPNTAAYLPLDW